MYTFTKGTIMHKKIILIMTSILIAFGVGLIGCDNKKSDPAKDEFGLTVDQRALIETKANNLDTIVLDVQKRKPILETQKTDVPELNFADLIWGGTSVFIQADYFQKKIPEPLLNFNKNDWLKALQKLRSEKDKRSIITSSLKENLEIQHIAVVRTHSYTAPLANKATKTFTSGSITGDVLLYDFLTASYLGGVSWSAHSKANVETLKDDLQTGLDTDMMRVGTAAVKEKVKELAGKVKFKK